VEQIRAKLKPGGLVLDVPDEVPAVWGEDNGILWAQGQALMICGPAGVGKTTLTGQIVRARLALGDGTVLGLPVQPSRKRVLYLAMDRPAQIRRSLRRLFTEDDREALDERLVLWSGPPLADLAQDTNLLKRMALEADADTVIVDSLKDAAVGLSEDIVGAGYNRARQAALEAGIEVLELHHQRKAGTNGSEPNQLADVYGSTWITAGAGSVIILWGSAGDPVVKLIHIKQPMDEVGPFQVLHDGASGTSRVFPGTDLVALARECRDGLTVHCAATNLFPPTDNKPRPSASEVEKARRRLNSLCNGDNPQLVKRGGGSKAPARYFAITRQAESTIDDWADQ
jgi:replicative DNA helicase